jgi:hypothetical protein
MVFYSRQSLPHLVLPQVPNPAIRMLKVPMDLSTHPLRT